MPIRGLQENSGELVRYGCRKFVVNQRISKYGREIGGYASSISGKQREISGTPQ
ncbi:hypothetical protein BpJC7_27930 [Weizmannia acidilactici]|uniref:Uncharacterized protein n=1 Tax=Weizmannia acidilactici TaxID=2607726 RepID=A0A5J4JLI6_9BACI|nr:hypothetical protein BpJC7_27930 [Weizmannia acidilactici]